MHLTALSAGPEAPRIRFNGVIHSVFDQACNIRVDDGRLLALLAPCLGNVPHGARIAAPAGFGFARHLTVGAAVGCRADVVRMAGLSIDLGTAKPWQAGLAAAADRSAGAAGGAGLADGMADAGAAPAHRRCAAGGAEPHRRSPRASSCPRHPASARR